MAGNVTVTVDTRELDRIAKKLGASTDQVIRAMGFEVQGMTRFAIEAQDAIDTGAYWNGIAVKTDDGEEYLEQIPESDVRVSAPTPPQHAVHVGPTVNYAVYVEFGTYKMAARPSLVPAFEAVARDYISPGKWKVVVE